MAAFPKHVLEHFKQPKNEEPLPDPQAQGEVEGRRADSRLTLYLRVLEGTIERATWTVEKDRSCRLGLSLLSCYLPGKTVGEAEALDPEALAAHYGLHEDQRPMFMPPLEALRAALANLRGEPSPFLEEGPLVCHCLQVREGRIRRAIRERELRSVKEVTYWTRACSGCRSCRGDVELLLEAEGALPPAAPAEQSWWRAWLRGKEP
ncbi:MAG: (2Fe-2S)-binding protein [Planctomycetes bacterium]|nr:(2Fe-2S)-binding protein [Planctomycetota bacterium]